ncbi:heparan-alpha-glucosaminide N-acetyltransferase isoform X3 [Dendrobium catenatum]|uniref:heparan-alpha-glucosaminide N-acetyltransferase isoform X3 n=1 Tax=Dendrobium catenatum TaxID=906689 RepID=UPI00109F411D|nr:heparan-alpha-glucosaminide N-acetyltransferase isoform X3 [Dendrobium catenatum]
MAEYVALSGGQGEEAEPVDSKAMRRRIASLDVFRGLSIALMIFVDYAGSVFPFVAHSPWHGVRLADFVTPFFLFIAGISLSLVYKKTSNKLRATQQAVLRALELFLLGILLQGGYFHGVNSLSFGIDVEKIRWSGILQRIAVGYVVAAVCEIWLSNTPRNAGHVGVFFRNYFLHWIVLVSLSGIYLGLLYGLYVPDWQFEVQQANLSDFYKNSTYIIKKVTCGVRGDLGPACNSAGMIDRYVLGIEHLYKKSAYRNLKILYDCGDLHPWSSIWPHPCAVGGDPLNKQLYTVSYALLTTGSAGLTFCALYVLVDVGGYRCLTCILEWMGRHSLSIFILVPSNIAIIILQGFYWRTPKNNIVHWVLSFTAHR